MATLWLTYGTRTAIEDAEDTWDARDANITCSADSGIYVVGTKSAKQYADNNITTNTKMASETISSSDLSTYTHMLLWARCTLAKVAGTFQLMLDDTADCASPIENIALEAFPVADQWYRHCVPLATPASDTAIISVGVKTGASGGLAATNSLYIDDLIPVVAKSFDFYAIRGLYDMDEVAHFPGIKSVLLDGSETEHNYSFKRTITVELAPIASKADRLFLFNWARAAVKHVVYLADDVQVVLENPEQFSWEWANGVESFRRQTLRCVEKTARTTVPMSWGYTI